MSLNYFCINNVSDEDCNKCMKFGIKVRCPDNCEYFDDERNHMPEWARAKAKEDDTEC
jgi:hypothetical protein